MPGSAQHWEAAKSIELVKDEVLVDAEKKRRTRWSACDAYISASHGSPLPVASCSPKKCTIDIKENIYDGDIHSQTVLIIGIN